MIDELRYQVPPEDDGRRVDRPCKQRLKLSRTLIRRLKLEGAIRVNGSVAKGPDVVRTGDIVEVRVNQAEEVFVVPELLPLELLYEDTDLAVVNKPTGMLTHPTPGFHTGTLVNALAGRWQDTRPRPVHRLDRGTSGVLVVARSQWAHGQMERQLHSDCFQRIYLAVVTGVLSPMEGYFAGPIGPDPEEVRRFRVDPAGRASVTNYRVLSQVKQASLVELQLETGRTHQIRVHLSHAGYPLLGDELYGGSIEAIGRPALHAWRVRFRHPRSGETVECVAPIPTDFASLLQGLDLKDVNGGGLV